MSFIDFVVEDELWTRGPLEVPWVVTADGVVGYSGPALMSPAARRTFPPDACSTLRVEGTLRTSALLRTILDVSILSCASGRVAVAIAGATVHEFDLVAPAGRCPSHTHVALDVTERVRRRRRTKVSLSIRLESDTGHVALPLQATDRIVAFGARQAREWWLTAGTTLAYALTWSIVFESLLLGALHVPAMAKVADPFKIALPAFVWLVTLSGMPDLARIPIRGWIRALVSGPIGARLCWLTLVAVVLAAAIVPIGSCLLQRRAYQAELEAHLEDESELVHLARAFAMFPTRMEVPFLFEHQAWRLRYDGRDNPVRQYVRTFIDLPDVKSAVRVLESDQRISWCACDPKEDTRRSLVWYAGILPEIEENEQTVYKARALRLLETIQSTDARILALVVEYDLWEMGWPTARDPARIGKDLAARLAESALSNRSTDAFQRGADVAGQIALTTKAEDGKPCNASEAVYWFTQVLETRSRFRSFELGWMRPPEKLALYHLFRAQRVPVAPPGSTLALAKQLLGECKAFEERFGPELYDVYDEFQKPDVWRRGTPLARDFDAPRHIDFLEARLLPTGWRY